MFGRGKQDGRRAINRILIVEDEPLIAFDNEHVLHEAGFTVVGAVDNAPDALKWIAAGGIDLITADVSLRGTGDGVDVARAAHSAGIAVLFVSGTCPVEAQAFAAGCLAKPYTQRDLVAAIQVIAARKIGKRPGRLPRGLTLYPD